MERKFISTRDKYKTPQAVYQYFNKRYHFVVDVAAEDTDLNANIITPEMDALKTPWDIFGKGYAWCNPPYSNPSPFVRRASQEQLKREMGTVMLLPASLSPGWFNFAKNTADEWHIIVNGRISFIDPQTGLPATQNRDAQIVFIWHPIPTGKFKVRFIHKKDLLYNQLVG